LEKRIPFLLSGGIRPEDASAIRKMYERYSNLVGIDVNSGFEVCPGEKSLELLNGFLEELRG
ncbi:MAG: hypothetical protein KDD64_12115, partial [Bdellovibrionales bacterium]|nr:hypothetical protein [Bdellovibrionales bacterium]